MNHLAIACLLLSALAALAVVGQLVVRKSIDADTLLTHQGITEPLLGVVGTLFSVLLGFLVAAEMDRYKDARLAVAREANAVGDVFRLARGLQTDDRIRVRGLCRSYGNSVIDVEWPLLEKREESEQVWENYRMLWESVLSIEPASERENNIHSTILDSMRQIGDNRRERLVASQYKLSPILWSIVGIGAGITVAFTYFFSAQGAAIQSFMTILITVSLGLNMWLLAAFSSPFSSELKIEPTMFYLLRKSVFTTPDTAPRWLKSKARDRDLEKQIMESEEKKLNLKPVNF